MSIHASICSSFRAAGCSGRENAQLDELEIFICSIRVGEVQLEQDGLALLRVDGYSRVRDPNAFLRCCRPEDEVSIESILANFPFPNPMPELHTLKLPRRRCF